MAMLKISDKVRVNGIQPELGLVFQALLQAAYACDAQIMVTSVKDGIHSDKSLHYVGLAVDADLISERDFPKVENTTEQIIQGLSPEYDVVVERNEGKFSHWHIEFQPKLSDGDRTYV